ncbi:MAG: translation initiation factor IF-2 N-terminal domain-containing protein, partial [Egibacteraceae bacterium]
MSKVRIYELAKETGLSNKDVIRRLAELGVDAKSHSSTVEDDDAAKFRESLGRMRAARKRVEEERARREAEAYDLDVLAKPSAQATARRILPPHLRKAAEVGGQPREAVGPIGDPSVDSPSVDPDRGGPGQEWPPAPAAPVRFRPPVTSPFRPDAEGGVSVGGDQADEDTQAYPDPARPEEPGEQGPPVARGHILGDETAPSRAEVASAPPSPDGPIPDRALESSTPPQAPQSRRQMPSPGPRTAAEAAKAGLVRPAAPPAPFAPDQPSGQREGRGAGAPTARGPQPQAPRREQQGARRGGEPGRRGEQPGRRGEQLGRRGPGAPPGRGGQQPASQPQEPRGVPGVPRPGTPPRPGQPTVPTQRAPMSSAATGVPVEPRRRVEHNLPKEGTGRRAIPPPLRPAPKQEPEQPAQPAVRAPRGPGRGPGPAGPRPKATAGPAPARPRPQG